MTELAIRGGLVFDGLGASPVLTDLHVGQHRLSTTTSPGARALDAVDCWVLPGFVDLHSHADHAVLTGEGMWLRHLAGITTEVVGQDGLGFTPGGEEAVKTAQELMRPVAGQPPEQRWHDTEAYLELCDRRAVSRVAALASHGTARIEVAGTAARPLNRSETTQLVALLATARDQGACGLSTGLSYPPARSSDLDEITAAFAPFADVGLPYVTHLRDYGTAFDTALDEAVEIARRAGGPLHLSHFHVSGPGQSGRAGDYLDRLDAIAREGLSITWDSYPYTAACTFLVSFLPDRVVELSAQERGAVLERQGVEIAAELDRHGPGATVAVGWDGFIVAGTGSDIDGRRITQIAAERGCTAGAVVVDLCRSDPAVLIEQGHLDNIRDIATHPAHRGGSDGLMGSGIPHPRAGGTFLRWLRWARDEVIAVPVPELVRRMTSASADRLRLPELGRLVTGAHADVVVIDPERLNDGPDHRLGVPDAVRHVVIGGRPVVVDGEPQPSMPAGGSIRWT